MIFASWRRWEVTKTELKLLLSAIRMAALDLKTTKHLETAAALQGLYDYAHGEQNRARGLKAGLCLMTRAYRGMRKEQS